MRHLSYETHPKAPMTDTLRRCPFDATIECMSTAAVAIVCALGILVPVLLGLLPSQRKRHAARR